MKLPILIAASLLAALAADQATLDKGQKEEGLSCTPCHSLRLIHSQRLSRTAWGKELDKMTGWGTKIGDRDALIEYLVANYGDDKAPTRPAMSKDGLPRKQQ